ncbi:bifunctional helix-turn-helix transcriptional regulator/GNAT family N-acetyltransferase [Rhodoferax saidenbachensis]|uniref:MarR family transcriptional regulator n=1 Tax=Rhodoferax saidenbachensis TaxID=1484693 RepID=A0A1P8KC69_9BURK|nr:bifunctional helix-turn-helix transcriptional regulator/GNAT family N-acetyltransferase [Rhodoferax saidenbachensis]APW43627.1 MarR family transcriptional regulator [Rhodoferax saidenbachensis]
MNTPTHAAATEHVKALRGFNRFYTQRIGVLSPYLGGALSLTEVRVLYELAHHPAAEPALTASALAQRLGLDMGYLSRILRRFEARVWLKRKPSPKDARHSLLTLTQAGHKAFAPLQQQSRDEAAALLGTVPPAQQGMVVEAMRTIEQLLAPVAAAQPGVVLRDPRSGDMGWVVQQHGEIYAREYGFTAEFEALVAELVARYIRNYQPEWERCWIAERGGQRVGAVFVVRKSKQVAQLRMLILTPQARGLGLGGQLTDVCIAFARDKGYRKMVLWTNQCLDAARAIYAKRGFVLARSEVHHSFGQTQVGETWELRL